MSERSDLYREIFADQERFRSAFREVHGKLMYVVEWFETHFGTGWHSPQNREDGKEIELAAAMMDAKIRKMEEALEFYAKASIYKPMQHGFIEYRAAVLMDKGAKAREALGRSGPKTNLYSTGPR